MKQARAFLSEVQPLLNADRPQLVFDLSNVKQMDAAGVDMLLQCMAQTMKRDGDLKLAAVSPQAAVVLELTRTDRLFEIYETSADAVRSYTLFVPNALRHQPWTSLNPIAVAAGSATTPVLAIETQPVISPDTDATGESKGNDVAA
jgi:anti-sigma B factor antagonist